MYEGKLRN